jgi:hypothetical protein
MYAFYRASSIRNLFKNQAMFPSMLRLGPQRREVAINSSHSSPLSNKYCFFKKWACRKSRSPWSMNVWTFFVPKCITRKGSTNLTTNLLCGKGDVFNSTRRMLGLRGLSLNGRKKQRFFCCAYGPHFFLVPRAGFRPFSTLNTSVNNPFLPAAFRFQTGSQHCT